MLEKIKLAEPEEIIIDEKCNYDEIVHQLKEWINSVEKYGPDRDKEKRCESCDEAARWNIRLTDSLGMHCIEHKKVVLRYED